MNGEIPSGVMVLGKVEIRLDLDSTLPVYLQISEMFIDAIRKGILVPGEVLPTSRALAEQLKVSRSTMLAALESLREQGWIDSQPRSGMVVAGEMQKSRSIPKPVDSEAQLPGFDLPTRPDLNTSRIGTLVKLSSSVPDSRLLDISLLGRAFHRASQKKNRCQEHTDPYGYYDLRTALAVFIGERRGISVTPESVLVTSGNRMALNLLAQALIKPGDLAAVEDPGDFLSWESFRQAGASLVGIPVDDQGINPDALEEKLRDSPIRLLYITPRFQIPTTVSLAPERRQRLIQLAQRHGFLIIEEDSEAEYTFDGRSAMPLASEGQGQPIIYLYSFARLLAPGFRMGCMAGPPDVVKLLAKMGLRMGWQVDKVMERAMTELLSEREIHRHIQRVRNEYRERRDAFVTNLQNHFGSHLSLQIPPGGLAAWVRTAPALDLKLWCQRCSNRGISFLPGSKYSIQSSALNGFRIGYAAFNVGEMDEILGQMAEGLSDTLGSGG